MQVVILTVKEIVCSHFLLHRRPRSFKMRGSVHNKQFHAQGAALGLCVHPTHLIIKEFEDNCFFFMLGKNLIIGIEQKLKFDLEHVIQKFRILSNQCKYLILQPTHQKYTQN